MQDLFQASEEAAEEAVNASAPLAARMRPRTLEEFVGQEHILGPGKLLRRAIEADRLPSVILSGPPGTGKTTLAHVIAEMTHGKFERLSGVESNVAEMRKVVAAAANRLRTAGKKTILFVDEIHHFNKAQQDILLPDVESGNSGRISRRSGIFNFAICLASRKLFSSSKVRLPPFLSRFQYFLASSMRILTQPCEPGGDQTLPEMA